MTKDTIKKGYKSLLGLRRRSPQISVGIHAQEGAEDHGGLSILEVATANEFGLGVPSRPFIRQWHDRSEKEHVKLIGRELEKALKDGKIRQHLERAALALEADCKQYISDGVNFLPNAPATIAKKGSSTPLIDTGALRASITGKVDDA